MGNIHVTTSLQKQIYEYQEMNPQSSAYNLNYLFKVTGKIDVLKLRKSIEQVFNQNPILSVNFRTKNNKLVQEVNLKQAKVDIVQDITEQNALEFIKKVSSVPMDMKLDPLALAQIFVIPDGCLLFMKLHHSIFDAMSFDSLSHQITNIYENKSVNFGNDFFEFLNNKVSQSSAEDAIAFESKMFDETAGFATENLDFQNSNEKKEVRSVDTDCMSMKLISKLADSYGVSTFCIILSMYSFVLSQMTYSKRVNIGIPFGNRPVNFQNSLGLFVNTLPVSINVGSLVSFTDLVYKVQSVLNRVKSFQNVDIMGDSSMLPERFKQTSINNVLTYYNHYQSLELNGAVVKRLDVFKKTPMFPINLIFERSDSSLIIHKEVSNQFIDIDFGKVFTYVLNQVIGNRQIKIRELSVVSDDNQKKNILKQNESSQLYKADTKTVIDLFSEVVSNNENKIAVQYKNNYLTYKQLDQLSNQMAKVLIDKVREKYVVVSDTLSELLIPMILAIFKAGKVYVPVDNTMPDNRKEKIFASIDSFQLVGRSSQSKSGSLLLNSIEELRIMASTMSPTSFAYNCKVTNEAYILFTSGSTGTPKGVQVTQGNIRSLFKATIEKYNFSSKDVWSLFHSYSFDFSLWEIFGALTTGAKLVIIPSNLKMFPDEFSKIIKNNKVSIIAQTPSAFSNLMKYESEQKQHLLNSIRYFFFGGEYISFNAVRRWKKWYEASNINFIGVYGVTEASVFSLVEDIKESDDNDQDIIGKPLSNTHVYLRGINGLDVPRGFLGEIILSGPGVGESYFKGTEKQNVAFSSKNLFFDENSFSTNDLGFINHDFDLVYKGRSDKQVKISGHRIELGEIENAINSFDGCRGSIVVSHKFSDGDSRLIGYFFDAKDQSVSKSELRNFLKEKLQGYMIPQFLIHLDKNPLTVNGKLDDSSLPIPSIEIQASPNNQTTLEKVISIWGKTLNRGDILPDDNFFDVGGSSLLITQVYYLILKEWDLQEHDFSMVDLYDYSTPSEVAEFIETLNIGRRENG